MKGIRRRHIAASLAIAAVAAAVSVLPVFDRWEAASIDVLSMLRFEVLGERHPAAESPVVVVALDEETYATPLFEGTPHVGWTPMLAKVLDALREAGVAVVGFDLVLPMLLEESPIPYGNGTLGGHLRDYDLDYRGSLMNLADAGRVVLGIANAVGPSRLQQAAVNGAGNVRPLNVHTDPDGVARRLPLAVPMEGADPGGTGTATVPAMAVELAARALGARPDDPRLRPDAGTAPAPGAVEGTLTLGFDGGPDDVPTYSLADLHACATAPDLPPGRAARYFRERFGGKVVLLGQVLSVEDRLLTSKRWMTGPEGTRTDRCVLPAREATGGPVRASIPGIYVHAAATADLLRGEALAGIGRAGHLVAAATVAVGAAVAAWFLGPLWALLVLLGLAAAWVAAGVAALHAWFVVLPLFAPLAAGAATLATTVAYRFVVSDRDKRLLRNSFSLYLAPAVVDGLIEAERPPELGGESRRVTVYFSDVEGFSSFSERLSPHDLVALMNAYLSAMTDIVEAHGGFVDKYIGDAIVAVFGAPHHDPDHALNAVRAALAGSRRLAELNADPEVFRGFQIRQRVGLNTGDVLVGNIGSRRRFNYTVMGDAVNLASRLEGANKYFGTRILVSDAVVAAAGDRIAWREIDAIRVKGRDGPVTVFEPLGEAGHETPDQRAAIVAYADGLARWRSADFAGAAEAFARVATGDPASASFLDRARRMADEPPGTGWEPVRNLDGK